MQNKLLNRFNIVCLLTLTTATSALACNGSHVLGVAGSSAVYTISANTMEEGSFYLGANMERVSNNTLSDAKMIEAMQNGSEHLHNIDAINSYSLSLSYGITSNLSLNMQLPYVVRTNIRAGENNGGTYEVHPHGDTQGIGDTSAILQYKVYDEAFKVAILGGIKAPTGKTDVADGGEILEADLQPGSGSWDLFAGASVTKDFDSVSLHSNILYKQNNKGVDDSQLGDIFLYNVALSYRLFESKHDHELRELHSEEEFGYSADVFMELNGEQAKKDRFGGIESENTGHNVVFATAGVQMATDSGYSVFLTYSTPIHQDFNGVQNDISYKSSFGIGKSF